MTPLQIEGARVLVHSGAAFHVILQTCIKKSIVTFNDGAYVASNRKRQPRQFKKVQTAVEWLEEIGVEFFAVTFLSEQTIEELAK